MEFAWIWWGLFCLFYTSEDGNFSPEMRSNFLHLGRASLALRAFSQLEHPAKLPRWTNNWKLQQRKLPFPFS